MNFIKEYMFETILVGVTVVIAAGLLWQDASASGEAEQKLEDVRGLGKRLSGLSRNGVTKNEFERRKKWTIAISEEDKKVGVKALEYNSTYPIIPVPGEAGTETAPMFPWIEQFDREGRARNSMIDARRELLASMNATTDPDEQKIAQEYARRLQKYTLEQQRLRKKLMPDQNPNGDQWDGGDGDEWRGGPSQGTIRLPNLGTIQPGQGQPVDPDQPQLLSQQQIQAKALRDSVTRFVLQSATAGVIYVDPDALERTKTPQAAGILAGWLAGSNSRQTGRLDTMDGLFSSLSKKEKITRLFQDHIRYWVFLDVINAIEATNDLAFKRMPPGLKPSVPTAAIKRLVWIDCSGQFFVGPQSSTEQFSEGMDDYRGPGGLDGPTVGETQAAPAAKNLTGDVSNKKVDIVHYTVYMIMDSAYLGDFQRRLAQSNYHTTLEVEMQQVRSNPLLTAGSRHYYGPEPVVLVRLKGQLRLLADLTRGKPKDGQGQANQFGNNDSSLNISKVFDPEYPPLAPVGVLERPGYRPALREVDSRRLPKQTETTTDRFGGGGYEEDYDF